MKSKILTVSLICVIAYLFLGKFVFYPIYTDFFQNHDPEIFFRRTISDLWDDSKGQVPMILAGGGSGISTNNGSKHKLLSFTGDEILRDQLLKKYHDHIEQSLQKSRASIHGKSKGNQSPDGLSRFSMTYTTSRCGGIIDVNSHVYDDRIHIDILVYEQKR